MCSVARKAQIRRSATAREGRKKLKLGPQICHEGDRDRLASKLRHGKPLQRMGTGNEAMVERNIQGS